ncbi:MAG: helix-turn-helix transcriptional regulator, partial [Acetivibrio ethanolgignens]
MNFGEQIKKIRSENGLTQEQLTTQLNVSRQTISSWENNRNLPDLEMVVKIAKVFNSNFAHKFSLCTLKIQYL